MVRRTYPSIPTTLKYEIVRRVRDGATIREVCADPDMPSKWKIEDWQRRDPEFAADLKAARQRREWWRRWRFDDARAEQILARLRAGETLTRILADPAMPSWRAFQNWRGQAPFAEEVARITKERRREQGRRIGLARRRPYDEALADRLLLRVGRGETLKAVLASDPEIPCLTTIDLWRRAEPEFDGGLRFAMRVGALTRGRARGPLAWQETLVARIVEGASLAELAREPGMPSHTTLYRWVAQHPEFAREIARACEDREYWYLDRIAGITDTVTPGTVEESRRRMSPLLRRLGQLSQRPGRKWLA